MRDYFEYGEKETEHLSKKDKKLGAAIDKIGMIRRGTNPDLFSALVESIISQQISAKAAATVRGRLFGLCGDEDLAQRLSAMEVAQIQACGMSSRKASYIKGAADAFVSGKVDFAALAHKSDDRIIKELTALNGVGVWTAEMLLIFSLQRPNVCSYGDLAIRRGMCVLYGIKEYELTKERFSLYAKRYAPYGSVASLYLWEISDPDFGKY